LPLRGPNDKDVAKLHSEVNQIENQRFLLTTLAITVFGVIASILVSKTVPPATPTVGGFAYLGSVLLLAVLGVIYLYGYLLKRVLRIYTAYLKVTKQSMWEEDYSRYRRWLGSNSRWHWGYDQGQTLIFALLGLMAWAYPLLIAAIYGLTLEPLSGFALDSASLAAYAVMLLLIIHPGRRRTQEEVFVDTWRRVDELGD